MGSMADEEYMTKFPEILRYVLYIKYEKAKVQRFVSGLSLTFEIILSMMSVGHLKKLLGR